MFIIFYCSSENIDRNTKSINDVPNEVIEKCMLPYLSFVDVISFGQTSKRFMAAAEYAKSKRSKSQIIILVYLY